MASCLKCMKSTVDPMSDDRSFKQNFSHLSLERQFDKDFTKHDVKPGQEIDLNYLACINFSYIDNFRELDWLSYLSMNQTYFVDLVCIFYFKATTKFQDYEDNEPVKRTDRLCTYVMGKRIVVAEHTLDIVLDLEIHQGDLNYVEGVMCDPPKQHVMHTKINEHAINKLGFVYVNNSWVRKETVNDPKFVGDEDCEDTFLKPSVTPSATLSAGPSSHPTVGHSYPPMSTSFDNEQAYSRLLSFMESMDARVVHKLDALEAQNQELLHHQ
ncbi:Uncharacterized protein TCM_018195 [Theobroma cacao]|uniref:Uncharacterized protein n=1 Tax=Theobroma cacao TaxID=3641 RepID=A0A061EEA2_THECC|nr:Uncharacterized protein TCM_018195 [Theobroma cacao]